MSFSISPNLPANVVEIGNELSQARLDAINNGIAPTSGNPFTTVSYISGLSYLTTSSASTTYATKASPTFTGVVTIPAGASISGYLTTATASSTYQTLSGMTSYLTTSTASSTYQTLSGMSSYLTTSTASSTYQPLGSYLTDAPSDGSEYVRKNAAWSVATGGGGGGGLTISTLSNSATSTLNATAPTTGQSLTFDGTQLIWASVGGGGGVAWGAITGTVTDQTDLTTYITNLGYITAVPTKSVYPTSSSITLLSSHNHGIIYLQTVGTMSGCQITMTADNDYPVGFKVTVVSDLMVGGSTITSTSPAIINNGGSANVTTYVSHLVKVAANTWFYL